MFRIVDNIINLYLTEKFIKQLVIVDPDMLCLLVDDRGRVFGDTRRERGRSSVRASAKGRL